MTYRCLVTGGAGFIGSHIADALLVRGHDVRILDDLSTGRRENLRTLGQAEFVRGDIRDPDTVREVMDGMELVFHQAALPSVPRSVADPEASIEVNVNGTLNVLQAARRSGARRLVFASSSSVYGDGSGEARHEAMMPRPLSPYAVSKSTGEQLCRVFHRLYGLETVSLRYFNVFGPRQDPASDYAAVIPAFVSAALRGDRPTVFGDGRQTRDFTFVANVVEANLLAATVPGLGGSTFNIATGRRVSLLDVLAELERIVGHAVEPRFEAERPGDVRHSLADVERARERMGYDPDPDFGRGLRQVVAALREDGRSEPLPALRRQSAGR